MNKTILYSLAIFSILFFTACGGTTKSGETPPTTNPTEPTEPTPDAPTPNNSAILSGPTIGNGSVSNDNLRKELPYTLSAANPNFELGRAYALVDSVANKEKAIFLAIEVTNISDEMHCFVELESFNYKDADETILAPNNIPALVLGSVAENESGFINNCLTAGEQGYFIDLINENVGGGLATYNEVASLDIQAIDSVPGDYIASETRVIPQKYSLEQTESKLSLEVKNEGPKAVFVQTIVILLDADDTPLYWSVMPPILDWDGVLEAGQANTFEAEYSYYEGTADKLSANLYFLVPGASSQSNTPATFQLP